MARDASSIFPPIKNAGEVDKVLADWVRGGTFEPGSYTRGLYQRGVE